MLLQEGRKTVPTLDIFDEPAFVETLNLPSILEFDKAIEMVAGQRARGYDYRAFSSTSFEVVEPSHYLIAIARCNFVEAIENQRDEAYLKPFANVPWLNFVG